jgi:hypothetical protein
MRSGGDMITLEPRAAAHLSPRALREMGTLSRIIVPQMDASMRRRFADRLNPSSR